MAPLKHHDIIRLRGTGSRKRTWDWLSGRAGGHLCNTREKKAHFCDRHHIARATTGLVPKPSTGTACAVLIFDGFFRTQPRQRGASLRLTSSIGSIPEDLDTIQPYGWVVGIVGDDS